MGVPKHQGPRLVTDQMRAAYRLILEGATRASVAKTYGVATSTVQEWYERVEDERRLAGAR